MNFASLAGESVRQTNEQPSLMEPQTTSLTYQGPQYYVKKAVQGSLMYSSVSKINAQLPNATWSLEFFGPALQCTSLEGDEYKELRTDILTQYAQNYDSGTFLWMPYLSWVPGDDVNGSLPFLNKTLRSATVGGSPMSLYVMIPPFTDISVADDEDPLSQVFEYLQNDTFPWQITMQNVSYSVDFKYVNGDQDVQVNMSTPLNNVSYLSGFSNYKQSQDLTVNVVPQTTIVLNQTAVETFAYQAIMQEFVSMIVGSIIWVPQGDSSYYDPQTSVPMTTLFQAEEMAKLAEAITKPNSSFRNVEWDGKSVNQSQTMNRSVVDLIPEMFRNATMSLMSEAALK
jgi:hypothetical protein